MTKERENARLHRATKKAEIDRKRLEMGSQYESDEEEKRLRTEIEESEEESDSYYDTEEYGCEGESEDVLADLSDVSPRAGCSGLGGELMRTNTSNAAEPHSATSKSAMGLVNLTVTKDVTQTSVEIANGATVASPTYGNKTPMK